MPDILVRGLDARVVKRLKDRAKQNGRSLQSEAKLLLEQGVGTDATEMEQILAKWRERSAGRKYRQSSLDILREVREL